MAADDMSHIFGLNCGCLSLKSTSEKSRHHSSFPVADEAISRSEAIIWNATYVMKFILFANK